MVLGAALGVILLVLVAFLMFRHFQTPSPRAPQTPQTGQLIGPPTVRMEDGIADNALPLRKKHHVHQVSELGAIAAEQSRAQLSSRRAVKQ